MQTEISRLVLLGMLSTKSSDAITCGYKARVANRRLFRLSPGYAV